jgi:hypothetical protein
MYVKELRVKIVSVSKPDYWYADKIGKEFDVEEVPGLMDEYFCPSANGYIEKTDCVII